MEKLKISDYFAIHKLKNKKMVQICCLLLLALNLCLSFAPVGDKNFLENLLVLSEAGGEMPEQLLTRGNLIYIGYSVLITMISLAVSGFYQLVYIKEKKDAQGEFQNVKDFAQKVLAAALKIFAKRFILVIIFFSLVLIALSIIAAVFGFFLYVLGIFAFILIFPAVILIPMFSLTVACILYEQKGILAALKRSYDLTKGFKAMILISFFISSLPFRLLTMFADFGLTSVEANSIFIALISVFALLVQNRMIASWYVFAVDMKARKEQVQITNKFL